ncbi:RHS repeat-associated core domain-containing protein [Bacillus horti]|uniref:RHS repeat-associated protein n=1 Tax=Caldalkalibacillus horti TaxID=77523 RepID=A0ABT9W5H1_9BACI|nr:RHS repeat-associated core domain-containing protein [Bacillus horti]MDQ0168494.1 RHS repeat-associated protein [Bacillus horti]
MGISKEQNILSSVSNIGGATTSPGEGGAQPGTTPKTLYFLADGLGSTLSLLTYDGRISSRYDYDEFGIVQSTKKFDINWPGPDNMYGYTGLEYEYYTDLNYARARYYKAEIGRFISEDSYFGDIFNPQSQNLYTYVHNNPVNFIDYTGNWCTSADKRYAHPGACSSVNSIYMPDYLHHGSIIFNKGRAIGYFDYYTNNTIDELFYDWSYYVDTVYRNAPDEIQESLRTKAFQYGTENYGTEYLINGLDFGLTFISGPAGTIIKTGKSVNRINSNSSNGKGKNDPMPNHSTIQGNKLPMQGKPNSSIDRVDDKGKVIQRRYYDENGRPIRDVDFTDHGHPKHHNVPHEHIWDLSDPNKPVRR